MREIVWRVWPDCQTRLRCLGSVARREHADASVPVVVAGILRTHAPLMVGIAPKYVNDAVVGVEQVRFPIVDEVALFAIGLRAHHLVNASTYFGFVADILASKAGHDLTVEGVSRQLVGP